MTDDALLDRVRSSPNDERLWTQLYGQLHPPVYLLAFQLSRGDTALAEDLTQEAFLRFISYGAIAKVSSESAAVAYLRAIIRNIARDYFGRKRRLPLISADSITDEQIGKTIQDRSETTFIDADFALLDGLTPDEQELLRLVVQGCTLSQIAEKTGVKYSNAAVRLHRLKTKLKAM